MVNKNNTPVDRYERRGAVWLALLAVAWLQLAVAVHQFDHAAEYLGETCSVCVQLDRTNDATVDHSVPDTLRVASTSRARESASSSVAAPFVPGFRSRAPPFS